MALYRYVKVKPKKRVRLPALVSLSLMTVGVLLLFWVSWPIVSFKILSGELFAKIISPVGDKSVTHLSVDRQIPPVVLAADTSQAQSDSNADYSNPNIWFPTKPQKKVSPDVTAYKISIPRLKIKDALVVIAGDDLNNSLIHYGGTSLPGEYGTSVIFGHSTLPQLYNPKSYKTIFTMLPTLKPTKNGKEGDEIFVEYDGVTYRYVVYDMVVTKPSDLSPLEQHFDDSYLTLITCVPPGTYWERLNVRAKLSPF